MNISSKAISIKSSNGRKISTASAESSAMDPGTKRALIISGGIVLAGIARGAVGLLSRLFRGF